MPTNNTDNIYSTEYEDNGTPIPSTKIGYDNSESGLEATTVQGAIDEIEQQIDNKYLLMGDFTIVASNKTYAEVINPETGLLADVNTMLNALADDEYVVIESLNVPAFDALSCWSPEILSNQTTLSALAFKLMGVTTTAILMVDIQMKESPRAAQAVIGATPAVTFTDLTSTATTQNFTMRYKKYKKV